MRTLIFETHATSLDNEAGLASGHYDVDLSPRGEREAAELGARYAPGDIALVATSDLRRAWRTADLAFGCAAPTAPHRAQSARRGPRLAPHRAQSARRGPRLVRDCRLREVDYGALTRHPVAEVDAVREGALTTPFPGGESYADAVSRAAACLRDIAGRTGGTVLVIGHRATHYAIAHLLAGTPLEAMVRAPFVWQPGWRYDLQRLETGVRPR